MIEIYDKNNINYEANGDMNLQPVLCNLKVELNGICELELEHEYDKEGRWKYIMEDNIIAASTPWSKKQLFRIYSKNKTMTGIKCYARHVFFDLINYILLDVRPTVKTGQEALNIILQGTPFKGRSNITKVDTAYYVRKNIIEALTSDDENSFVNRWGGERLYDNYNVIIDDRIGIDRGVKVEFGYNLEEIEEEINLDDVVTRIIPTGFDGIMLSGNTPWVDSPNINKYVNVKTRVINFEDVKVKEKPEDEEGFNTLAEAQVELKKRCKLLYDGGIDQPRANYKVNMVNLLRTTTYKDYKDLETVSLGDTVPCKHKGIDIEIKARCISLEWDCINNEIISLELGNFEENYFNNQTDITNRISNILNDVSNDLANVLDSEGKLKAEQIKGFINATNAKIKAQKDIAQKQHVRAMLFEDLDPSSPTYGCVTLGTQGIMCSTKRNIDNSDWVFTSALTSEGLIADKIVGNLFASKNGLTTIDMNTGKYTSVLPDGSKIIISPNDGFYNQFGTSKREYHHLNYSKKATVEIPNNIGDKTISVTLPSEFRNKNFEIIPGISDVFSRRFPNAIAGFGIYAKNINKANATFDLVVNCTALALNYVADQSNGYKVIDTGENFNTVIDYNFSIIA